MVAEVEGAPRTHQAEYMKAYFLACAQEKLKVNLMALEFAHLCAEENKIIHLNTNGVHAVVPFVDVCNMCNNVF